VLSCCRAVVLVGFHHPGASKPGHPLALLRPIPPPRPAGRCDPGSFRSGPPSTPTAVGGRSRGGA